MVITQTANPKTYETLILRRIQGFRRGAVFSAQDFADLGNRSTVDWVLQQLMAKGKIRRLSRGIYDYPQLSAIVGLVPPDPYQVARAITSRDGSRLQPTGAYAANLLGLSDQIPARIEFLTESDERIVQIGNQEIILRKTTPRIMQMAGKMSGLVTQAFRFIGKDFITPEIIAQLRQQLSEKEKTTLRKDIALPPAWIANYFRQIIA
jgi:predicted transcriptional regulator of viral defense system